MSSDRRDDRLRPARSYRQGNGPWSAYDSPEAYTRAELAALRKTGVTFVPVAFRAETREAAAQDRRERTMGEFVQEAPALPAPICDGSLYTDHFALHLHSEAWDKYKDRLHRHFGERGDDWGGREVPAISRFLSEHLGRPVTLVAAHQYNHARNGYPVWQLFWHDRDETYRTLTQDRANPVDAPRPGTLPIQALTWQSGLLSVPGPDGRTFTFTRAEAADIAEQLRTQAHGWTQCEAGFHFTFQHPRGRPCRVTLVWVQGTPSGQPPVSVPLLRADGRMYGRLVERFGGETPRGRTPPGRAQAVLR